MVITRSQSSRNRQIDTENMDRTSDNESETSFPELLSREQMVDPDSDGARRSSPPKRLPATERGRDGTSSLREATGA